MSGGLFQLVAPVLAEGTPANTSISNTATASYEDPTDTGKQLNTVSNTVTVQVAEVAGITVTANSSEKVSGTGPVQAGDNVRFLYTVTNTGNDPSKLNIPSSAGITGPGTVQTIEYSEDGSTNWLPVGTGYTSNSKLPGESLKVRVTVLVAPGAQTNQDIIVTLGNTETVSLQNAPFVAGSSITTNGGDVYTEDNIGTANDDIAGAPENGRREASDFLKVTVNATPQAFATITKIRDANLVGSTLGYDLGLSVAGSAPISTNKAAEDLAAAPITLNGTADSKILVSDAVPNGTKAKSLVAPSGWTAVYTLATTGNANAAAWLTAPADLSTVTGTITRVGFVKDGTNATVVKGSPAISFRVVVEIITPSNNLTIGNIAQVFGSTNNNGVPDTTKPVYDESGDDQPNNFNNGVEPATNPVTSGVVDAAAITAGTDGGNNNTGTGPAGEPNVFGYTPTTLQGVLNGTFGKPEAVGPGGNNTDFTNKSTAILTTDAVRDANGLVTVNPAPFNFSNTFQSATNDNISLLPQVGDLPVGSKVTLTDNAGNTKTYEVTLANGLVNVGTAIAASPLVVTGVIAGTKVDYTVQVDLPSGSAQLVGYSTPIVAFIDSDIDGIVDATEKSNITIDKLYTGYLKVEKEAQILNEDGSVKQAYTANPTVKAAPGEKIQYRINYTNISDDAAGSSGSVGLDAQNIKVTEDGVLAPNNWAATTSHQASSAVDNKGGVIVLTNGATPSNNNSPDVTKYVNTVAGPLTGQQTGSFTFIRTVDKVVKPTVNTVINP
jgi:hypothetical protein